MYVHINVIVNVLLIAVYCGVSCDVYREVLVHFNIMSFTIICRVLFLFVCLFVFFCCFFCHNNFATKVEIFSFLNACLWNFLK
jgi:hypothetical protein